MTSAAALEDDRSFLVDGRRYFNARQAAIFCGYEPKSGRADDKQMRAFHQWASSRGIHQQPGRGVYLRTELEAAIERRPDVSRAADLDAMRRLAREDVADRRRRARLQLRRSETGED